MNKSKKIALLSNVNVDPINRLLRADKDIEVYDTRGYGNELGLLINNESPLNKFNPDFLFIIIDIMELVLHDLSIKNVQKRVDEWFGLLRSTVREDRVYYISDTYLFGSEMDIVADFDKRECIEHIWIDSLRELTDNYSNIRVFPYNRLIRKTGEKEAYSLKMWYLGKIPHTNQFNKAVCDEIRYRITLETRTARKVLLLDLDNTLWGGLVGENDNTPIVLSDDGLGLVYKNFQRSILKMKEQGAILGIVSKNNEDEAVNIIQNHPHMILRMDDFVVSEINWNNKSDNIREIADELNVGLDSIVFIDDSPFERNLIKETLPEVAVPDFPENPEDLLGFITCIYRDYFEKTVITSEDKNKTEQYRANKERKKLMDSSVNFDSYLESLEIKLHKVDPSKNRDRLLQLMNKTNQFNLTTKRFSEQEVSRLLNDDNSEIFLYSVSDRFGDNGVVIAAIVEYGKEAVISEFTMSCRVMGRKIESAVVEDIEDACRQRGYQNVIGVYIPTEKNRPVQDLYSDLGYTKRKSGDDGSAEYIIELDKKADRKYHLSRV